MNKLSIERKTQVIKALVEGNSIRATCRMTDTAKGTVTRLLVSVGAACAKYQDEHLRNLPCKHIQCDEVWSFCYSKQKNVPIEMQGYVAENLFFASSHNRSISSREVSLMDLPCSLRDFSIN